jgi:NitT/TauT family transport system substrate-binding protein
LFYVLTTSVDDESLDVIITDWAPYGFVYVAQEKGIFEKNDLIVDITFVDESESLLSFPQGFITDGSLEVLGDTIFTDSNHVDSQFVYVFDESGDADVVISHLNSISELKGKSVGIWEIGGFSHIFLLALLEKNGLDENDVTFVELNPDEIVSALNEGVIDAGHTFNEENIELSKIFDYKIIATERDTPGLIVDGIMFKTKVITERPDDVFKFIKSFSEAQDYCTLNIDECISIIALNYDWDDNLVRRGLSDVDLKNLDDNVELFLNPDSSLYKSGEFIIKTLQKHNQISYSANIHDIINPFFVNKLNDIKNP